MRVSARTTSGMRPFIRTASSENGRIQDDMTFEVSASRSDDPGHFPFTSGMGGEVDRLRRSRSRQQAARRSGRAVGHRRHRDAVEGVPDLQGTLLDPAGARRPADLLFPDDPDKSIEESRLTRVARPDETGRFVFHKTVPGSYYVVALDYVQTGDWNDPAFLEALRPRQSA